MFSESPEGQQDGDEVSNSEAVVPLNLLQSLDTPPGLPRSSRRMFPDSTKSSIEPQC